MRGALRSVLAVGAGLLSGFLVGGTIEAVSHHMFPMPSGLDSHDPKSVAAYMAEIPTGAIVSILVGWTLATLIGSAVAARLARSSRTLHGFVVGAAFLAASLATLLMIPHPLWFWAGTLVLLPASSYAGARIGSGRPRPTAEAFAG
jgi:hypothetical protein